MIRLLIVDDEKTIRNGLAFAVPWNEHGYIVVYTAKNGIDALHFMKTHYADIIISDIKMPRMDGLTLQKEIRKKYPQLPFIFISGYEDFTYAQAALKNGAFSYILKPIDVDELLQEVDRACEVYHLQSENMPLKQIIDRNFFGLEKKWDFTDYEHLEESCMSNYFCIINIRCQHTDMHSQLFLVAFQEKIQQILVKCFTIPNCALVESSSRGIIFCVMNTSQDALKYAIYQFVQTLTSQLKEYSTTLFGVWTGGIYRGIDRLIDSYVESFDNNSFRYFNQHHDLAVPDSVFFDVYSQLFGSEDLIISFLLQNHVSEAKLYLEEQKDYITAQQLSVEDSRLYLRHLLYRYIKALLDINPSIELPPEIQSYGLFAFMNTPQMFQKLYEYFDMIQTQIKPISTVSSSNNIKTVKHYIQENYADPYLSLSTIAAHISLNASYLCTEFTKSENMTLSSFITNVRIEHAQNLLLYSEMRIADISLAVGYLNATYFSTTFKKVTGQTPSEFRKQ